MEEKRITAPESRFDTFEQRFDVLEQRYYDMAKMFNIVMNKMSCFEEKSITIHETSSPMKKTDHPKVLFEEPMVTPPHLMSDGFKVEPSEAESLTLLSNIEPTIFLEDQLNAKCSMDICDMKYNPYISRPDSITSAPSEMTFDERLAWLVAAKKFCTKTLLRTDQ